MALVGAAFLLAIGWVSLEPLLSTTILGVRWRNLSTTCEQIGESDKVLGSAEPIRPEATNLVGQAADLAMCGFTEP